MEERDEKIKNYWKAVGGCVAIQDLKTLGRCYFALKALYAKKELPIIEYDEPETTIDSVVDRSIL